MTSVASARALASTGLTWDPARGDRFVIPDRGMDEEVFVLSDMTIETHDVRTGRVIGFNGTTEWALDSVDADDVLWLPGESALRALLGPSFGRLEADGLAGWAVTVTVDGDETTLTHPDAEEAYALALLAVRATTSAALLPLAAHAVVARADALDAAGERGWTADRLDVLDALVRRLRVCRARFAGADADGSREEAALVEDADPVAEDRCGTLRRAVVAATHALTGASATGVPGGGDVSGNAGDQRDPDDEDALLVDLVVGAHDLGADDVAQVCVRRAVDSVRARAGSAGATPSSVRAVQSVEAGLEELLALLRG